MENLYKFKKHLSPKNLEYNCPNQYLTIDNFFHKI